MKPRTNYEPCSRTIEKGILLCPSPSFLGIVWTTKLLPPENEHGNGKSPLFIGNTSSIMLFFYCHMDFVLDVLDFLPWLKISLCFLTEKPLSSGLEGLLVPTCFINIVWVLSGGKSPILGSDLELFERHWYVHIVCILCWITQIYNFKWFDCNIKRHFWFFSINASWNLSKNALTVTFSAEKQLMMLEGGPQPVINEVMTSLKWRYKWIPGVIVPILTSWNGTING